jgi:hypothetical protein
MAQTGGIVSLTERLSKDRRETDITPIVERRGGNEQRVPEWRRRAIEQHQRSPWLAVNDLTETGRAA